MKSFCLILCIGLAFASPDEVFQMDSIDFKGNSQNNSEAFQKELLNYKDKLKNGENTFLTQDQQEQLNALNQIVFVPTPKQENRKFAQQEEFFNIESFLDQFQEFDCNRGFETKTEAEILDPKCMQKIQDEVFGIFSDITVPEDQIYNHFYEKIYQPLAIKSTKKETLSDTLYELINNKESMIGNLDFQTKFSVLQSFLMKNFETLINLSDSQIIDKSLIQSKFAQILQIMHLFWNILRQKGQLDKARVDTKQLLTSILEKYQLMQSKTYFITQKLVDYIVQAYNKFIRAHQAFKMMEMHGLNVISDVINQRYIVIINKMYNEKFPSKYFFQEISKILDLGKAFNIYSFVQRSRYSETFNKLVIKNLQNTYFSFMQHKNDIDEIKHFTAILILKLIHQKFIISSTISPLNLINNIYSDMVDEKSLTVKVYYSMMDHLIMVPIDCQNSTYLRTCVTEQVNKSLNIVTQKYQLKKQINGWRLKEYLDNKILTLFDQADQVIWTDFHLFQTFYYQNLFRVLQ